MLGYKEYLETILESDTASVAGMGGVVAPQASVYSGTTSSPGFAAGGGTEGSGDVPVCLLEPIPKKVLGGTEKKKTRKKKVSRKAEQLLAFDDFGTGEVA